MSRGELIQDGKLVGTFDVPPGTRNEGPVRMPPLPTPWPLRPDGLAVDTSVAAYALKRLSPFRDRWPEVREFDEQVERLDRRQADVNVELAALQEQLPQAQAADREALARWVAASEGDRPVPAAPGIEQRIADLTAERDALEVARQHALDDKTVFVERHRKRLVRDAAKARKQAVEGLDRAIRTVEAARAAVVGCVQAERWAREFPGELADAGSLRLDFSKGGRLSKAIPDLKTLTVASQLFELLRDDARWLDSVLVDEQEEREPDPHHESVWEDSPEGREAVALANKRIAAGLQPRNVRSAGWGG